ALVERSSLDVTRVVDLTASYACTLGRWIDNVRAHRARIEELSPGFARVLQVYMTIARLSFQRRRALEYMIVATAGRPSRPLPCRLEDAGGFLDVVADTARALAARALVVPRGLAAAAEQKGRGLRVLAGDDLSTDPGGLEPVEEARAAALVQLTSGSTGTPRG